MPRVSCSHCGLPVASPLRGRGERVFCCYGCYLVSRVVGAEGERGVHAWHILRLSIGALLAMNVMMISLLLYTGEAEPSSVPVFRWVMLALATPAMLVLGYPFLLGAAGEVARRRFSLDTLIAVGSFTAFLVSAVNTVRGSGHVYFDTATMLPLLVTFGKVIEATAKTRTGRLVRGLETLLPGTALRLEPGGETREVPLDALQAGDHLRVRPGERLPADGRIVEGQTVIEEAAFTGEAEPRRCGPGDPVLAGTVNGAGPLVVCAERVGEDLLLRRIIAMVEDARQRAAPSERLAERAASAFVPGVFLLALGAGLAWAMAAGAAKGGLVALAVMVVACPCAMGIATPLATALAIGRAARAGALVRGGDVLERLGTLDTVCFDKTGTLTTGHLAVQRVVALDAGASEDDVLGWLAGLELGSEHAVARAVAAEAKARALEGATPSGVHIFPGQGIRGHVTWRGATQEAVAGTPSFVGGDAEAALPGDARATAVAVAWGGRARGVVFLADAPRPDAAEAVRRLQEVGVATVLLSGDRAEAASAIAGRVSIRHVEAPLRPDDKVAWLRSRAAQGHSVGMVGDGINDAPALAAADVGIALGAGTDLARQAGHAVLLGDRLVCVPWLIALSLRTRRIVRQNLAWAFGYNAVALAAAAAGVLHPLLAAVAMVVSSVTVLSNSARICSFPGPGVPSRRSR